jgi:hypothetical protein
MVQIMTAFLEYLKKQREEEFAFTGQNHLDLVEQCMQYIGDQDGEIRDHVIYPALAHLLHDNHLSKEELTHIATRLIGDEYLTFDINNKEQWSVLKRSFTLLQLVILLYVHRRDKVFSESLVRQIFNQFVAYCKQETVFTGYDEMVGWVHAIAHSGDVMVQLVQLEEVSSEDVHCLLDIVFEWFTQEDYLFISDEDERIVGMMEHALRLGKVSEEELAEWVRRYQQETLPSRFPQNYYKKQNMLHMCRSLFFRIEEKITVGRVYETMKKGCKYRR